MSLANHLAFEMWGLDRGHAGNGTHISEYLRNRHLLLATSGSGGHPHPHGPGFFEIPSWVAYPLAIFLVSLAAGIFYYLNTLPPDSL